MIKIGLIDFTPEDIDALYKSIVEANTQTDKSVSTIPTAPVINSGGVY